MSDDSPEIQSDTITFDVNHKGSNLPYKPGVEERLVETAPTSLTSSNQNASALLYQLINRIPDGKSVAELFSTDGVLELPFLYSLGLETRYVGREAIANFYTFLNDLYLDFKFTEENTKILIDTPQKIYAEYSATVTAKGTGRKVTYLFAASMVVKNGQITYLREFLDVLSVARALNPDGLKDIPAYSDIINSVPPDYQS